MTKRIRIQIFPDGRVQAETEGIKGKACTSYISILQEILDAEVVDSTYTPEYHEKDCLQIEMVDQQRLTSG